MAVMKISDVRQRNDVTGRATDRAALERASTFVLQRALTTMAAADYTVGILLYDCEFLGGYIEQEGDEGANGTITIEKWDDVAGSTQVAISSAVALDAGAAEINALPALTTGVEVILRASHPKINAVIAGCDGAVAAKITLYFKLVDDVGLAG